MDNIFKTENNKNVNQYNNSNLSGDYKNTEIIQVDKVKSNEEIGTNIINNAENILHEKQLADLDKLLKPDTFEIIDVEKNPVIDGKFIQKEVEIEKEEQIDSINTFDELFNTIVPTDNTIVNQYKTPDIKLGNKNN